MLDEARAGRRHACVSLYDVAPDARLSGDPAALALDRLSLRELWRTIDGELRSDAERLVARLSFRNGLSPRQIRARHPEHFRRVADVYRLKRNVLDRLRASQTLLREVA
jgi:hypothetical protein